MNIKKRNNKIDTFIPQKIKTSIINSAYDINYSLTDSDIKLILYNILKTLTDLNGNNQDTSVYEVRGIIYCILIELGFKEVAISYMNTEFNK